MSILKRIEKDKHDELTLGMLLAAVASMAIIAFCLIQMEGYEYLKFGWFLLFVVANIIYISVGMERGWAKPDPANALVIASGPLAFFFWTIVGIWNKYVVTTPKLATLSKKMVLDEINQGVADANKKMPAGAKAGKVYNVIIKSHYDILRELNDEITERLKKFDVFDIEVPIIRMEQFLQIVVKRNLDWRPSDIVIDGKEVVVIGKKSADFDQYEEKR